MTSTSTAQLRKIKKPIIEKKRRQRMNDCLNQLKTLVLEGKNTNCNEPRYSKMEKVDILEMTVRYLKDLRHSPFPPSGSLQPPFNSKYIEGYNECAVQVCHYLTKAQTLSEDTHQNLRLHLANSLNHSAGIVHSPFVSSLPFPESHAAASSPRLLFPVVPADSSSVAMKNDCDAMGVRSPSNLTPSLSVVGVDRGSERPVDTYPSQKSPTHYPTLPTIATEEVAKCREILLSSSLTFASGQQHQHHHHHNQQQQQQQQQPQQPSLLSGRQAVIPGQSLPVPLFASPTLLVFTGSPYGTFNAPSGLLCASPRQGDEYPSYGPESPRGSAAGLGPKTVAPVGVPPTPTALISSMVDTRGRQTPSGSVWRPWHGKLP